MIEQLLSNIPDKFIGPRLNGNLQTTSHKFKTDVWNYFSQPEFADMTCVEFGTHRGETTHILSHLFKEVHTFNKNESPESLVLNKDLSNITHHIHNLQQDFYPITTGDVIFIDANHDEKWVYHDIVTSLAKLKSDQPKWYIFDDWGINTAAGVRMAIRRAIDENLIKIEKYIGHPKDTVFYYIPDERIRVLNDWEGVICRECL